MTRAILIFIALCLLVGCGGEGYFSHLVSGGDKVPALYTLEERPTLILVDDPADRFADPNLPLTVAINIEHHLKQNEVLVDKIIAQRKVADLQAKHGLDFASMPVDRVGRELEAEQVIYVLIDDVALENVPGVFRPKATAQVKVIDVKTGRRLFPNPPAPNQPIETTPTRGHPIVTEMSYKGSDINSRGTLTQLKRQLAETVGRDAARLFYKWKPPEIGHRFEEP